MKPMIRTNLADSAAERLREEILVGNWSVGERIPNEASLSLWLSVSRGTVREAVRVLVAQGLLETKQGSGTYVLSNVVPEGTFERVRRSGLRDLWEARAALDIEAARLAALRHTPADIEQMFTLLDARGTPSDDRLEEFSHRDIAFHKSVVAASRNQAFVELYDFFTSAILETIRSSLLGAVPEPDERAHADIVEAIRSGDPELAANAARRLSLPMLHSLDAVLNV